MTSNFQQLRISEEKKKKKQKEERKKKPQDKNIMTCPITQSGHNKLNIKMCTLFTKLSKSYNS